MSRSASTKLCTDLFVWMPRDPLNVLWMTMKNTCAFIFIIFLNCKTFEEKHSKEWNVTGDLRVSESNKRMVTEVLGISSNFQWKLCLIALTYMLHPHKEGKETTSSSYGVFDIYSSLKKRGRNWGRHASRNYFWDSYYGRACRFLSVSSNSPRSLCKNQLGPVSLSFLRCRIVAWGYSCSHLRNCSRSMTTFNLLTTRRLLSK